MKTTKILAVSAAVCALLTGCLKNEILPQDDGEKFNLNVTVSTGDATKASGVASAEATTAVADSAHTGARTAARILLDFIIIFPPR